MSSTFIYTGNFVADLANFPMPEVPDDAINILGGKTWDKKSFPEHPFANGNFQNARVANGTHHLLNTCSVVGPKGDVIRMPIEEYRNQSIYVSIQSNEGYIRRGLDPNKDRQCGPKGSTFNHPKDSKALLTGSDRSEAQQLASLNRKTKLEANRLECPHCKQNFQKHTAKRWHFDNCRVLMINSTI